MKRSDESIHLNELPPLLLSSIDPDGLQRTAEGLGTDDRRKILMLLVNRPMTRKEIANKLSATSRASIYRNIEALLGLELLRKEEDGGKLYYHARTWYPPKWEKMMEKFDTVSEELLHFSYFKLKPALNEIAMKFLGLKGEKPIEILPEWKPCPLCEISHSHYEFFLNLFVLTILYFLGSDDFTDHLSLFDKKREEPKGGGEEHE